MDKQTRNARNEEFVERLMARRPAEREHYKRMLCAPAAMEESAAETGSRAPRMSREQVFETIVLRERPVLFIKDGIFDTTDVTIFGTEAIELIDKLSDAGATIVPLLPLIGRIDVTNFGGIGFLGTGWFVDTDIVVTNRHVARLIAEQDGGKFVISRGVGEKLIEPSLCNAHEFDDLAPDAARVFKIKDVLYIEPKQGKNDIAFVRVERRVEGARQPYFTIAAADIKDDEPVCVIGYPARAPSDIIPDQKLMKALYRDRYDVKRAAPGLGMGTTDGTSEHDCTTLGGNSGSIVINLKGEAVGLHYAGLYMEANYAVSASVLRKYIDGKSWNSPIIIRDGQTESKKKQHSVAGGQRGKGSPVVGNTTSVAAPTTAAPIVSSTGNGSVSITIPLTITVGLGAPIVGSVARALGAGGDVPDAAHVEEAVKEYWDDRPDGVLAVRVGYLEEGTEIGDHPCIAVSVVPNRLAEFESSAPDAFNGIPVRYFPAEVVDQIESLPIVETVDSIAYDDDARTGDEFSFEPVTDEMNIILHVGPEYSWEVLEQFLREAEGKIVSAMYEFHAEHIKDAIERRLKKGAKLTMVLDNATFTDVKNPASEFDREEVFEKWSKRYGVKDIVAPEGLRGLISDSYHIKVTVRPDDTFWLSSGNWKAGSSQPIITQDQRDDAANTDLLGNREWHVVIKNKTLATRFRSHILQDFERSAELRGEEAAANPLEDIWVDVPIEEARVEERKPPGVVIEPEIIDREVTVQPLLTPDRKGEVYSEAVLELIRSAEESLLFQIPYIGMPQSPRSDRGYIDELIQALTKKLKQLKEKGRVILRSGGSRYSSPTHAAWYFKSKGINIDKQLRVIENHHTKGMIVDGRYVLLGSHNWSKPGVTLNRDASLIFDDADIASYYTRAFEIDWNRANKIRPRRFVKSESPILEATGFSPPAGYERVRLSELLKDD